MFDNIGYKIKKMAKVLFWGGIIVSVLACWGTIIEEKSGDLMTDLGMAFGWIVGYFLLALGSWVFSWLMYGFGTLIENSTILVETRANEVLEVFEEEYQKRKEEDQ